MKSSTPRRDHRTIWRDEFGAPDGRGGNPGDFPWWNPWEKQGRIIENHWIRTVHAWEIHGQSCSGWWFGTFFIFPYIGNNHPNWLIFFRWVETTNQCLVDLVVADNCYFISAIFLIPGTPKSQRMECDAHLGVRCHDDFPESATWNLRSAYMQKSRPFCDFLGTLKHSKTIRWRHRVFLTSEQVPSGISHPCVYPSFMTIYSHHDLSILVMFIIFVYIYI